MQQPERKYQLFPRDRQPATAVGKALDPEQAFALAMRQNGEKSEKAGLRIRIKDHNLSPSHALSQGRRLSSHKDAFHTALCPVDHAEICRNNSPDDLNATYPDICPGLRPDSAQSVSNTMGQADELPRGGHTKGETDSKRSTSSERRAFEQLPKGWKASDALTMLSPPEVASLQKQALQQASRFEVLRKEDVDSLSRELRQLDERCEYLRRTYTSLRAGRRNLHTRICQYLRSPRTAKFSHEAMLKQEEALAELDTSIDEWVNKLEYAENRRTRVRQKLLEHVAAAITLAVPTGGVTGTSDSLQHTLGARPPNAAHITTPPRSPAKTTFSSSNSSLSPSPHRTQVPSTIIEQPLFEEAACDKAKEDGNEATLQRAETIRIYADNRVYAANGVYALMADVEDAITQMGGGGTSTKEGSESQSAADWKRLSRARSHELLKTSLAGKPLPIPKLEKKLSCASLASAPAASTARAAASAVEPPAEEIYLTSAVYKPPR
ncbi:hypothetical protein N0V88_002409 [Collariella sp. IMI 366227]|nr:hypothetical protein N0V88_002409 [Collariella sp. IMI 366227]